MEAIEGGSLTQETNLIPAARRAKALELIRRDGAISIQRLADEIGMSISTARRDVDYLSAAGYLERTHGGALLSVRSRTTFEPATDIADQVARPAKIAIGRCAAGIVEDGQSVILDSSSTVLEAAHALTERDLSLTVVTNDLRIAIALRERPKVQLIVPGGQVRPGSFTLVGSAAQSVIRSLHADIALIGVHSLAQLRPSETSLEVASLKQAWIGAANRVLLLLDSSKFEQSAFCEICPIQRIHDVICDDGLDPGHRRALEQLGVRVTLVPVGCPA
ncbi:DeoR/GlpR family DNA-binding transcription regulator [Bradyrhizobium septentrionale]|uniref:DeoR/GlpR family DNA-binding transcription regulator n=1 Tax=Bradyrhizobium septentrionale TaxID=1404411 RepID=UPI0015966852|nr:DeoR/GlpR family DNA-binding transcription regulator [Bradyrhizobium septentrionale]UGY28392.1 DeoR/GlpR family DNA-binding transcription regulator [Bradyrhizobium septentrionale]